MTDTTVPPGAASDMRELGDLFEDPLECEVDGRTVRIHAPTFRHYGRVQSIWRKISDAEDGRLLDLDVPTIADLLASKYPDESIAMMVVATNEPADWLDGLRADRFLKLGTAVIQHYLSFYLTRWSPHLKMVATVLNAAATPAEAGRSSSRPSNESESATPQA